MVYKYLSVHFALKVVRERKLKISEFGDTNDPFELGGVKLSDGGVHDILVTHMKSSYGALCFTNDWNTPPLEPLR